MPWKNQAVAHGARVRKDHGAPARNPWGLARPISRTS